MFIKRLKPNVYDVFVDNGWSQWARVVRERDGRVMQVAGSFTLNERGLSTVKARITK